MSLRRVTFRSPQVRLITEGETRKIAGTASVFDAVYDVGGMFFEVFRKGSFDKSLSESKNLRVLNQHRDHEPLGSHRAGTAKIWADDQGLHYYAEPPDTSYARDLMALVERGELDGSSIGFYPLADKETWTQNYRDGRPLCEIHECRLLEASPVTWPASEATGQPQARALVGPEEAQSILKRAGINVEETTEEPGERSHSAAEPDERQRYLDILYAEVR
jgi:HK97 family phage prohead protease